MSQWKYIGPVIALSLAGCVAPAEGSDEESVDATPAGDAMVAPAPQTGEAAQAFYTTNPFDHLLFSHFYCDRAPFFGPFGFLGAACSGFGGCF